MDDAIVQLENLVKAFKGEVRALDGLSLTVPPGSVYSLLGPNGAGKTTLIRVLSTLLPPDQGLARVAGVDVRADPAGVRARIGLAGQSAAVDEVLTGRENVELVGRLYGLSRRQARQRAGEVLERIRLAEVADRLADRIAVIDHGRLVSEGTGDELKDRVGGSVLAVTVPEVDRDRALRALRGVGGQDPTDDRHHGKVVLPAPDGARTLTEALRRLDAADVTPEDVALHKPTLDDVFLALTGQLATTPNGNGHDPWGGADRRSRHHPERAAR